MTVADRIGHGLLNHSKDGVLHHDIQIYIIPVIGYLDLLSLWFISKFGGKPMHIFGFLGSIMFLIGFVSAIVVGATPDGRFAGEQLADGGLSPMLGQDAQGPTAVLKSVSKLDNTLLSNGTLLNVKFPPATLEGEAGLRKLADFLRAFTQLKLQHIQFNVVNADTLREAQQRPQDYAGLVVRVAGYSAFFVELSKEIQDDIIRRTAHQL